MSVLSELNRHIADTGRFGSTHVFLEPDTPLCAWLEDNLEPDQVLIDCGAKVGALGAALPGRVVGIDIMPAVPDGQRSVVLRADCISWDWATHGRRQVPIFIRPCHSGFVDATLAVCIEHTTRAFYIGKPENVPSDLPGGAYAVHRVEHLDWTGPAGEKVYFIHRAARRAVEMGLYARTPDAPLAESSTGWRRIIDDETGEWPYGPGRAGLSGMTQTRHLVIDVAVYGRLGRPMPDYAAAWDHVLENPRWARLTSGYVLELERRNLIMKRLEGARRITVKTENGRVVVVPVPPLMRWRLNLRRYFNADQPRIPIETLNAIWTEVSPPDMKMINDDRAHTDLMYCITVDGEPVDDPADWNRMDFRDVQRAVRQLYSALDVEASIDPSAPVFHSPSGYADHPETFADQPVYLCGNEQAVIRGVVARPRPGEETPTGQIAVLPNGTINYHQALTGASALIIGVGGAVCHIVNVARGEGIVVMRFDGWDDLEPGADIEIDVKNRTITMMTVEDGVPDSTRDAIDINLIDEEPDQ